MQLYILDKDPIKSAQLIPDKYKFKMLIELGQLICSCGLSDVYKSIAQGKELQEWILKNAGWVQFYYNSLFNWACKNVKMKFDTINNIEDIRADLAIHILFDNAIVPTHAYFRYAKEYKCSVASKTLLPIEDCIAEYKKYLEWKLK